MPSAREIWRFLDVAKRDAGALDCGANGNTAELGGSQGREAAEEAADRGADRRDDDGLAGHIGHWKLKLRSRGWRKGNGAVERWNALAL